MQGLADIGRVESVLLARRSELVQSTSFVFSVVVLVVVLGGFAWFLQLQYQMTKDAPQEKRIPFEPTVWYSATRNVRSEEYAGLDMVYRDLPTETAQQKFTELMAPPPPPPPSEPVAEQAPAAPKPKRKKLVKGK